MGVFRSDSWISPWRAPSPVVILGGLPLAQIPEACPNPDLDPPYDVYYQQILEQIELAEELGWECFMFNEHHFLG